MCDTAGKQRPDGHRLLLEAAAGDKRSWDAFVNRHLSLTWGLARGCGLDPSESAQLVAAAWCRLGQQVGDGQIPDNPIGWLAYEIRQKVSVRSTRLVAEPSPLGSRLVDEPPVTPSDAAPEAPAETSASALQVLDALQKLPPGQRLVLRILASIPSPTTSDVAQALGIPEREVARTAQQALARLRAAGAPSVPAIM